MKRTDMYEDKLKFSQHALLRQVQRDIRDGAVNTVMQYGKETDFKDTRIFTDEKVKIVLGSDNNTIITVNKNKRNTRFLLSERTKQKEESLLYKINKHNNDSAMCELAELYLNGELGEKKIEKAQILYENAARMGNSHAMCKLSEIYQNGYLGSPNQELADKWMKMAADRNNAYALAITGQKLLLKYLEKYPAKSNYFRPSAPKKEILQYLNKAADRGSTRGIYQLGNIYEQGSLGEKDLTKAKEFYVRAAKLGSPSSLKSLHQMTAACTFPAKELEDILDYISSYIHRTSIAMALQLGRAQLYRELGRNPIRGLKLIEQTALKQYDAAIHLLSRRYQYGLSGNSNLKLVQYWNIKLKELYNDSAKAGNVKSLWKLGKLYLNGNFDNIDFENADLCFKKAIEKSSRAEWIFFLGGLYLNGSLGDKLIDNGVEFIAQAIKIWQLQAASGIQSAFYKLGYAYSFCHNRKKAIHWLSRAPSDDHDAQIFLAKLYLDNLSHEKNILLGLKILESVILDHGTPPSEAFHDVKLSINAQTVSWLQGIADSITEIKSNQNQNQYNFQKFILARLAKVYKTGELGAINYDLASKYYHQLLVHFECFKAGRQLVHIYSNKHLPTEYYDTVKKWALQIPVLLDADNIGWDGFIDCIWILGKLHKIGDILPYNIQEATKWLYFVLYYYQCDDDDDFDDDDDYDYDDDDDDDDDDDEGPLSTIKQDLAELPSLNCNQKIQIVSELSELTKHMKITSLPKYKIMSRILGDIFYDGKIVIQNIDKSIYWYTQSAHTNNALASFKLAEIYRNVKQEINTSIEWYMLSTQLGNEDAVNVLTQMVDEENHISISSFLDRYQYRSVLPESELENVKPFRNLKFYPRTSQQMFELGKSMLNSEGKHNILNAVFWFKKAMENNRMEAAIELYLMYKSGILGMNLVSCAGRLYLQILNMCHSELRKSIQLWSENISNTLQLLNNVSSVLKISDIATVSALYEKIKTLVNETNKINTETLVDIISDLETITAELYSQSTSSDALDVCLLTEDISNEL